MALPTGWSWRNENSRMRSWTSQFSQPTDRRSIRFPPAPRIGVLASAPDRRPENKAAKAEPLANSAATENTLPKRIRGRWTDHRRRVISAATTRVTCKSKGAIDLNRQREQREASNCGEPRDPFHG